MFSCPRIIRIIHLLDLLHSQEPADPFSSGTFPTSSALSRCSYYSNTHQLRLSDLHFLVLLMAASPHIPSEVKAYHITRHEMIAICYQMSNSSNRIDAQDIELLNSVLKDFEKSEEQIANHSGVGLNVWKDWAKQSLENRKRAMALHKRMEGVKAVMEKVEQDWHVLNRDGGIGKGTTAYADWELKEMEDGLETLEGALRKKRRIV